MKLSRMLSLLGAHYHQGGKGSCISQYVLLINFLIVFFWNVHCMLMPLTFGSESAGPIELSWFIIFYPGLAHAIFTTQHNSPITSYIVLKNAWNITVIYSFLSSPSLIAWLKVHSLYKTMCINFKLGKIFSMSFVYYIHLSFYVHVIFFLSAPN